MRYHLCVRDCARVCHRSTGIYLFAVWVPTYQLEQLDPPLESSFGINAGMMFVLFFIMLGAGPLSDRVGHLRLMKWAAVYGLFVSIPAFLLIGVGTARCVPRWLVPLPLLSIALTPLRILFGAAPPSSVSCSWP